MHRGLLTGIIALSFAAAAFAQTPPPAGRQGAPARLLFWVSSTAWPDGGEIPLKNAGRGENKSPAFEFHWNLGTNPGTAPDALQTYAVILHDIQNSSNKGTGDTLHWSAFNIPGTAKGLPEGIAAGDLPDGTRNGPGAFGRDPITAPAPVPDRSITMYSSSTRWIRNWTCRPTQPATNC